ncbi:MAG: HAD family hydrolase [Phycisphaerae bacterium]|nr:HAD family hydrolase [Phycisphaerae bacterium]
MKKAVLFDLGNTLVAYYGRDEWPGILAESIREVTSLLEERGLYRIDPASLPDRIQRERVEADDYRVRPLEGRLSRIFELAPDAMASELGDELSRRFLRPTFALARRYDDALPVLGELRQRGLRTAILSNSPWGSPPEPWREEVDRHGLTAAVDAVAFCRDVGYRKPAPQGFRHVMSLLDVDAGECVFVGDDPRWDLAGPRGVGMEAILIDRTGVANPAGADVVTDLTSLLTRVS